MFVFNNTEEEWFCSWVVMRRKFIKSQENVKGLIKDLREKTSKTNDVIIHSRVLKEENIELKKSNKFLISRIKELEDKFKKSPISEAEQRLKMIQDFNKEHNTTTKKKRIVQRVKNSKQWKAKK
jgi:hypothetical protein